MFMQSYPAHTRTANQMSHLRRPDAMWPSHCAGVKPVASFRQHRCPRHTDSNGVRARALFGLFQACGPRMLTM